MIYATKPFEAHVFTLTTWLHDGFTYAAHRARDEADWKRKLAGVVAAEAALLGIHTELEF